MSPVPDPTLWTPWLFALLALIFVVRAIATVRRLGGYDAPAAKAHVRVAGVFVLVAILLFAVL
jgi:hypothetical protein